MTTWLYIGTEPREFPGDGRWPSFVARPEHTDEDGEVVPATSVEADENPHPLFFDQAGNDIPADPQLQE